MKKLLLLAAVLCGLMSSPLATAGSVPNLKGNWVSEYPVSLHHGFGKSMQTISITEQSDANFRGSRQWESKQFLPAKKTDTIKVKKNTLAFAGVVGFDGKTLYMADHGQASFITAKLTGPNTMQVIFLLAGEPACAYRATFVRK